MQNAERKTVKGGGKDLRSPSSKIGKDISEFEMPANTVETRNIQKTTVQSERPSLWQLLEKHAEMEANYHSTKRDKERIPLTAFQRQIEPQREYSPVILDETSREMPNISSAAPARDHQYQQGMDDEKATAEYEAESWLVAMWMTRMEPTLLAIQRTFEATRRGNQLRLHQEAAEHAPKASNDKAAKRTPAEDARAPLTENSIASEPRLEPDGDDDHLWQVYTFPGKSGVTLGIYLRGLGAMNQVKIDKLLYQLFHEAGESMAWPAQLELQPASLSNPRGRRGLARPAAPQNPGTWS